MNLISRLGLAALVVAGLAAGQEGDWTSLGSVRGSFLVEHPPGWTVTRPREVMEEDDSMIVLASPDGRVQARFEGNPLPAGEAPPLEEELAAFRESLPLLGSPGRPEARRLGPAEGAEALVSQVGGNDTSAGGPVEALVAVARTRGFGYRIYIRAPRDAWEELGPTCRRLLDCFAPLHGEAGPSEAPGPPDGGDGPEPPEFPEGVRPLGPPGEDGLVPVAVDRMDLRLLVPAGWEMLPPDDPEEEAEGGDVGDDLLVFTAADPGTGSDLVVYLSGATLYETSDPGELMKEFLDTFDGVRFGEPEERFVGPREGIADDRVVLLARGEGDIEGFGPARVLVAISRLPEGAPLPLVIASVEATPDLWESMAEALERAVLGIAPLEE